MKNLNLLFLVLASVLLGMCTLLVTGCEITYTTDTDEIPPFERQIDWVHEGEFGDKYLSLDVYSFQVDSFVYVVAFDYGTGMTLLNKIPVKDKMPDRVMKQSLKQ